MKQWKYSFGTKSLFQTLLGPPHSFSVRFKKLSTLLMWVPRSPRRDQGCRGLWRSGVFHPCNLPWRHPVAIFHWRRKICPQTGNKQNCVLNVYGGVLRKFIESHLRKSIFLEASLAHWLPVGIKPCCLKGLSNSITFSKPLLLREITCYFCGPPRTTQGRWFWLWDLRVVQLSENTPVLARSSLATSRKVPSPKWEIQTCFSVTSCHALANSLGNES